MGAACRPPAPRPRLRQAKAAPGFRSSGLHPSRAAGARSFVRLAGPAPEAAFRALQGHVFPARNTGSGRVGACSPATASDWEEGTRGGHARGRRPPRNPRIGKQHRESTRGLRGGGGLRRARRPAERARSMGFAAVGKRGAAGRRPPDRRQRGGLRTASPSTSIRPAPEARVPGPTHLSWPDRPRRGGGDDRLVIGTRRRFPRLSGPTGPGGGTRRGCSVPAAPNPRAAANPSRGSDEKRAQPSLALVFSGTRRSQPAHAR